MRKFNPYIKNFDSNCSICNFLKEDETDVIYEGDFFEAVINPRWSPHAPFRTAIVPYEHFGDKGKYGLEKISNIERKEYREIRIRTTEAIIKAAKETGNELKTREGQPLIDYMERPSIHPSGDTMPQFKRPAKLGDHVSPRYLDTEIDPGNSGIEKASVIVGSFPKDQGYKLTMPEDLRREAVKILKKHF